MLDMSYSYVCCKFQAVATVEVATDRLCIESKGNIQAHLSEEQIVSCCTTCGSG